MNLAAVGLEHRLAFDAAGDFDAFARQVPARWAVVLLAAEGERPVQLLCVKDLRHCLRRRLGPDMPTEPSKRVDYRQIVRRVAWRRVDSAFEADWIYTEVARAVFPKTYQGMVGFRPAWFVHVVPEAEFPRYMKTTELTVRTGELIGPVEDKHAAAKLIELAQDAFDLCRYHHILVQAPDGKACAYKEMGKCPAPCDGSISIEQYRRLVEWSAGSIVDPQDLIRQQTRRMQQAAEELRFETAARIKTYINDLSQLGKGSLRHARRLSDFWFVSLQRSANANSAIVFLITPGQIIPVACLLSEPSRPAELLRTILAIAEEHAGDRADAIGAERISIVAHHLFSPKQTQGVFLPLSDITEAAISKGYRDLQKQKIAPATDPEGEGVLKELQAMD